MNGGLRSRSLLIAAGIVATAVVQLSGTAAVGAATVAVGEGATDRPAWEAAAVGAGLGTPTNAVHAWGPGCIQDFTGGTLGNGALMQRNCTGSVYPVTGAHWSRVSEITGPTIGYPVNASHRWGNSWTQDFDGGTWGRNALMIPDSNSTKAFVVRTGMWDEYTARGGATGFLGAPTADEVGFPDGSSTQTFDGGTLTWSSVLSEAEVAKFDESLRAKLSSYVTQFLGIRAQRVCPATHNLVTGSTLLHFYGAPVLSMGSPTVWSCLRANTDGSYNVTITNNRSIVLRVVFSGPAVQIIRAFPQGASTFLGLVYNAAADVAGGPANGNLLVRPGDSVELKLLPNSQGKITIQGAPFTTLVDTLLPTAYLDAFAEFTGIDKQTLETTMAQQAVSAGLKVTKENMWTILERTSKALEGKIDGRSNRLLNKLAKTSSGVSNLAGATVSFITDKFLPGYDTIRIAFEDGDIFFMKVPKIPAVISDETGTSYFLDGVGRLFSLDPADVACAKVLGSGTGAYTTKFGDTWKTVGKKGCAGEGAKDPAPWRAAWSSSLGYPVNTVHAWGPGCTQDFRGGTLGDATLMQKNCTGAVYAVTGAHWTRVAAGGADAIGYPINSSHRWGNSWTQDFDGGTWGRNALMISDANNTKAFVVRGGIWTQYSGASGATGKYGTPLGEEYTTVYGARQDFSGGFVKWVRYQIGEGSPAPSGWSSVAAGLGDPVNAVHAWGPGCIQDFRGGTLGDAALMQKNCTGTVYPVTGAHWTRVAQISAATIGYPINSSHRWGSTWTQDFDGGAWGRNGLLIPDSNNTKAFVVRTGMWQTYAAASGPAGKYGVPLGDEYVTKVGARQDFSGGPIIWRGFWPTLGSNQTINTGQYLLSNDERFQLVPQGDGNLVLYGPSGALWATNTSGRGAARLVMQSDGNLVLYNASNQAIWSTGTDGYPGARVVMQDDGNVVVYDAGNYPLWSRFGGRITRPDPTTTTIRSAANGRFLTAELGYGGDSYGMLRANATDARGWEQFQLIGNCRSTTGCSIRSVANGRYVSAELNYAGAWYGVLRARSNTVGGWERFRLTGDCYSTYGCAIQSAASGRYATAQLNYTGTGANMVRANATAIQGWEKFRFN